MELGIDLGTATTIVGNARRGILFDEPTVMLLRHGRARRDQVVAVGLEAADLLGRVPTGYSAVRPLQDGVVTDLETARTYLRSVLHKAGRRGYSLPVRAVIGVPVGSSALEHRALLEAAEEAGIRPAAVPPARRRDRGRSHGCRPESTRADAAVVAGRAAGRAGRRLHDGGACTRSSSSTSRRTAGGR